jgi:hypothetical protein
MRSLLPLFAFTWLMALLWLVLLTRLLQRLAQRDPAAYAALGRPVMRWLWWSWPNAREGLPPFLSLTGLLQRRVALQTRYAPAEVGSMLRLVRWILCNSPRLTVSRRAQRLQVQLRLCVLVFALGLVGVVVLAVPR